MAEKNRCSRCGSPLKSLDGNVMHVHREDECYEITEHYETKVPNSFRDLPSWQVHQQTCSLCRAPFVITDGRVQVWLGKDFRHYYCSPEHAAFGVEGLRKLTKDGLR